MSYSNKTDLGRQSQRREEDPRDPRSVKHAPLKPTASKLSQASYDNFGKMGVNSPCAFHPSQKITNFCTSKECLLPLCPKCVKIHTDEHIKMGIFGQFDTIEESLRLTEDGLRYSFQKLAELETLMLDIKEGYEAKVAEERRKLREAKNILIEHIENIFDGYEKALITLENQEHKDFLQEMYNSDTVLTHLTEHFQKCHKKIGNTQTLMEGIINYYAEAEEIERVEISEEKLQKLFPETINVVYHMQELDRIDAIVKRYIDVGKRNDSVWSEYKRLTSKDEPQERPREQKKDVRLSPIRTIDERGTPQKPNTNTKNTKISELGSLQSNLNLGKFKSPLDNFSLSNRKNK